MSVPTLSTYRIDSTLELVADHFDAITPGSELFRVASPGDRITLRPGLLAPDNTPQFVTQISSGVIDEWEITATPTSIVGHIRGRDQSALALDRFFKKLYRRAPAGPKLSGAGNALKLGGSSARVVFGTEGQPPQEVADTTTTIQTIEEVVGRFMASQIAADASAFAGLRLSWEVRDYELQGDFTANGRVIDVLRALIRPWTFVEPMKAEVWLQGDTLYVKSRVFPPIPQYQLTLLDMKKNQVTIRKRRTRKVGVLTLLGENVSDKLTSNPLSLGIGSVTNEGEQQESRAVEVFGPEGLISVVETVSTYKMPTHTLTKQIKTTYGRDDVGMTRTARETIVNTYEDAQLDASGAKSQPKQKTQSVSREALDPNDGVFKVRETEDTGYSYDGDGFQTGSSTLTKKLSQTDVGTSVQVDVLKDFSLVVKTLHEKGSLLVEQITETYNSVENPVAPSLGNVWQLVSRDTQDQAGHRPGGPGRAQPRYRIDDQPTKGGSRQIGFSIVLSTDSDAVDVQISDANLTADDLAFLLNQFQQAQGLWEYEVIFSGVGMPWLRRGTPIQIIGIFAEDGTEITLPVLLVTEAKTTYDESKPNAEFVQNFRAFGWRVC